MQIKVDIHIPTRPLRDAIHIKRGISWAERQECEPTDPDAIPVLRIPNVQETLVLTDLLYLKGVRREQCERFGATKGWTLLVGSNGNPDRVGNSVYLDLDQGFLFASFLMAVAPRRPAELLPKFLFHYFRAGFVQQAITDSVQGTTGLKNLSQQFLGNLPLPEFQFDEQCRIADILDTADATIRQTEEVIMKLRQVKAGLLHDLLTHGLDEQGRLRDPERQPEQFKTSPLGRTPVSWRTMTVAEGLRTGLILDIQDGNHGESHPKNSDFVSDGIPFLLAADLSDGLIDLANCHKITEKQYHSLRVGFATSGDVLLSHKGTVGETAIVPNLVTELMLSPQVTYYRLPTNGSLKPAFLHLLFQTAPFQRLLSILSLQSTRSYIGLLLQKSLPLVVPPTREQDMIIECNCCLSNRIAVEERRLSKLKLQKRGLMHDLLTGRVRV